MEIQELVMEKKNQVQPKVLGRLFEFYVSGQIGAPEEYVDMFDQIRHASENDMISIYINSQGGYLATAVQFMRVMAETEAHITCSVEGDCMSAATLIFLAGHAYQVTSHSAFMFHNYSGGAFGKGGELIDQITFEKRWSEKLMADAYKNFLTEDEIKNMMNNKDIWMDGEEVIKRLKARQAKLEKEMKANQKKATPVQMPTTP